MSADLRPGVDCPSPEDLAAFVDGRLSGDEHAAIVRHVAECDDCYEVTVSATHFADEVPHATATAAGLRPGRYRTWVALGGLAAAALLVIWLRPFGIAFTAHQQIESALTVLLDGYRTERPTAGRLSRTSTWASPRVPLRSATETRRLSIDQEEAGINIRRLAADRRDAGSLAALGLTQLVAGQLDDAIATLESAVDADKADWMIRTDLSAAYLERWTRDSRPADAASALDAATIASQVQPSAPAPRFNAALALEANGLKDRAIAAWQAVIDAEPGSPWATEAREHIERLRRLSERAPTAGEPVSTYRDLDRDLATWADATANGAVGPLSGGALTAAKSLRISGRDTVRSDLVEAIVAASSIQRREDLANAIQLGFEASLAFDSSEYVRSSELARQATARAKAAGLPTTAYEGMFLWAEYWANRASRASVAAQLEVIRQQAIALGYWHTAGRMAYLSGQQATERASLDEALDHFGLAKRAADHAADPDLLATVASATAEVFRNAGDSEEAWRYHHEAVGWIPNLSPRRRHIVFAGAAQTAFRAGQPGAALVFADCLAENAQRFGNPAGQITAYLQIARAQVRLGQSVEARRQLDRARSLVPAVQNASERDRYEGELSLVEGLANTVDRPADAVAAFTNAIAIYRRANLSVKLPEVLLHRARAHRTAHELPAARADLLEGVGILEQQEAELGRQQFGISRLSDLWDLFAELLQISRDDPVASLAVMERATARTLLASAGQHQEGSGGLTPAGLSSWLPPHTTVLVYATLTDELLIWRVRRESVALVAHPVRRADLQSMVQRYVDALRTDQQSPLGETLSRLLLPGDLGLTTDDQLAVVPDGPLHGLPFAALPYGPAHRPLVTSVVPVVSPSLTLLALKASDPVPASGTALLVGYGEANSTRGLSSLPDVHQEIQDLVRHYPQRLVLEGLKATPAAVLGAMPHATTIHLAGHAAADEVLPSRSSLFLAPEAGRDQIRSDDISGTKLLPGSVVVLSGCETLRGRVFRGEGAMSLARPFLAAGASSVIASLWPTRDRDARELLTAFHAQRLAPARALAVAQRQWIEKQPGNQGWTNFVIVSTHLR